MAGQAVIAVDVGGTKVLTALIANNGAVLRSIERRTVLESEEGLLAQIEASVLELAEDDAFSVGVGVPSTIDYRTGEILRSVNIPLAEIDLRRWLAERLDMPVVVDNDANLAALGESRAGAGRDAQTMVMLTLGTGCGGGLVIGGKLYRGWAEFGHLVIDEDGLPCQGSCSGRGHLEAYVTGPAATKAAREAFGPDADAHHLVALARTGDRRARQILAGIGRHLGAGIATLVNVFTPDVVVVGGGFGCAAAEFLFEPAAEVVRWQALPPASMRVRIVRAKLGREAGLIGAAVLARDSAVRSRFGARASGASPGA
jgi:glucokinase